VREQLRIKLPECRLLPSVGNMAVLDNKLAGEAQEVLRARLPEGWETDLELDGSRSGSAAAGTRLNVRGPDGRVATLAVHAKRTLQPRGVIDPGASKRCAWTHEVSRPRRRGWQRLVCGMPSRVAWQCRELLPLPLRAFWWST
jgi:hypothetical protein